MLDNAQFTRDFDAGTGFQGGDVFAEFFTENEYNTDKSEALGRPVYDSVVLIRMIIPGDPGNQVVRRVRENDKKRFAKAWEAFENEAKISSEGTPIDDWPRLRSREVAGLKHLGIYTVEQLSNLSDANLANLGMGGQILRDQAKAFLEAAKKGAAATAAVAENARLKTQIDMMQEQMSRLTEQLEKYMKKAGADVAKFDVEAVTEAKMVQQRAVEMRPALPAAWHKLTLGEMVKLCESINAPLTPRTKDEAVQILSAYENERAALKQKMN